MVGDVPTEPGHTGGGAGLGSQEECDKGSFTNFEFKILMEYPNRDVQLTVCYMDLLLTRNKAAYLFHFYF